MQEHVHNTYLFTILGFLDLLCFLMTNCLVWYCSYLSAQSQDPSWSISLSYRWVLFSSDWLPFDSIIPYCSYSKHWCLLQVDEDPGIRTNTTILLGNIANYMNDGVCLKYTAVMLPIFLVDFPLTCYVLVATVNI